jgi:hypothetical protein
MKLGTHMPGGERRKSIDIEDPTIFVLFLEVVILIFDLQTSISIDFLLSPSGMCVPSFI